MDNGLVDLTFKDNIKSDLFVYNYKPLIIVCQNQLHVKTILKKNVHHVFLNMRTT